MYYVRSQFLQDAFWSHTVDELNGMKDGTKLDLVCKEAAQSFLLLEAMQSIWS